MTDKPQGELLTITETAKYIGVTRATIYMWMKRYPDFPRCRVGKITRIPGDELNRWMGRKSGRRIAAQGKVCPLSGGECTSDCAWITDKGCAVAVLASGKDAKGDRHGSL